jgi:hypothetical protein
MFKKLVSSILLICFTSMSLIVPGTATAGTSIWIASASGVNSSWATHAANANNWVSMANNRGYGQSVLWPKDNYTKIGEMTWARDATNPNEASMNWKMIEGERWITNGREDIGKAGISSAQMSSRIDAFPKTAAFVFAAYSPESADLVIEMQKIEKTPMGQIVVYRGDFTPHHGEFWKWKRDFLTPTEASDATRVGYNPFQNFRGANTDPVFHNCDWKCANVAIGFAMRYSQAHVAWVAADKTRFEQHTKKSGGLLKKKVTTYIDGYAKPQWFVATAVELQPEGGMHSICVVNTGAATNGTTSSCDSASHMATSGISMVEWTGGNMPNTEEKIYSYVHSKSSFTVIAFTILTFAVTWGLASALSGVVGAGAAVGSSAGISALQAGLLGAGIYAGVAVLGGATLTTAQAGWAGSTGNGVLTPDYGSMDQHQQRLVQGVKNKQINSRVGTGLAGVKSLYSGSCAENYTSAQCKAAGLDPGAMRRPDTYIESNTTLQMREAETRCKTLVPSSNWLAAKTDPVYAEQLRVWVQKCSAPKAGEWTVTTGQ